MVITYLGAEFFKVQFGDITLAFNPISKDSALVSGPAKLKASRFGADIVLVSAYHEDFNGIDQVTFGDKKPFVVSGPGEYEVKGVFIKGLLSQSGYGQATGNGKLNLSANAVPLINTIYTVSLENMNICFLGALNTPELANDTVEALDEIDILFVPIGGDGVLEPAKAYKLAVSLEPKIIIPMHYGDMGGKGATASAGKDALKAFLKEAGENPAPVAKLTLKKKDLEGKEGDIVVLESSGE
jgi:L-ascorbate metabolism protein UlaG (beta-lactamase superfamily)